MNKKYSLFLLSFYSFCSISAYNVQDDDIAFEEPYNLNEDSQISNVIPVHRVWGLPDVQAIVGKLFILKVPKDAFAGDIEFYEASIKNIGQHQEWPKWLDFDKQGSLRGVPLPSDVGIYYISITAISPGSLYKSKDVFSIEVLQPGLYVRLPETQIKDDCQNDLDPIFLTILLQAKLQDISCKTRISIIENISGYFGLSQDNFFLHEQKSSKDLWSFSDSFYFIEGLGHANKTSQTDLTAVSFQVGCGKKVKSKFKYLIDKIKSEALDGTLSEVLLYPVVGWHAKNELPIYYRERRQIGSGDQYEEDEEEEDDYNEPITSTSSPHPHRHHHGEDFDLTNDSALSPSEVQYQLPPTSLLIDYDEDLISTPMFIPDRPTEKVEPTRVVDLDYFTLTTSVSPYLPLQRKTENTNYQKVTLPFFYGNKSSSNYGDNFTDTTSEMFMFPNFTDQISTGSVTTDSMNTFNVPPKVNFSVSVATEEIEPRNFKPTIAHRLKKVAATAGKVFRFKIPDNTFADIEDGSTMHMSLNFRTIERKQIPPTSWIKFDSINQEIWAIPLEEHVSKWEFEVVATDKDGDSVSDIFSIQIQHHKGHRAVNFEFSAILLLTSNWSSAVDWQNKMILALIKVYGDEDMNQITVRNVSQITQNQYRFSWTNDTLPRSYCPRSEIDSLYKVIANDNGDITEVFKKMLGSGIVVKKISILGIGQCESKSVTPTPLTPQNPHTNFSPVPRNQIDQVNATAGCLLVFKVPEDTCYDPEDGGTRKLKVSLLNMDRTALDPTQWLQFDTKNQEFYGVPMDSDVKSQEYQLVCEDREGLTANDGLIVTVLPKPKHLYSVEFTIAVDILYESFLSSSTLKRKFIEKLKELFGDSTTDFIVLGSIVEGSTIITWYNRSLPTEICPTEEIRRLREILINDDESMNERLVSTMGSDFPVISVGLEPAGACQGELTVLHKPEASPPSPEDNLFPIEATEDYLFTFVVPAILIAVMLILAGIIACLFYRKRRASKMGIEDHDEKQSFRSKGIPVIFQDELEEKPEPDNKCPVIMEEEKPPLPPPEYQKLQPGAIVGIQDLNDDTPYQPPPPFTSTKEIGRSSRPKPTPTYRKPPPYVPP